MSDLSWVLTSSHKVSKRKKLNNNKTTGPLYMLGPNPTERVNSELFIATTAAGNSSWSNLHIITSIIIIDTQAHLIREISTK